MTRNATRRGAERRRRHPKPYNLFDSYGYDDDMDDDRDDERPTRKMKSAWDDVDVDDDFVDDDGDWGDVDLEDDDEDPDTE